MNTLTLTSLKDYGHFLTYPNLFVTKIVKVAECVILKEVEGGAWLGKKYFIDYLSLKILRIYSSSYKHIFPRHEHAYKLVKKIVYSYCVIHHAKLENLKLKKNRVLSKLS